MESTWVISGAFHLRGYLTSKPACGTFILLNMKRNVHEEDLSDVIELLRKHRVYVVTVGSNTMVNSADTFKQLYTMSVGSNGMLSYDDDSDFNTICTFLVAWFASFNPYYFTSVQVSGNGSVELPMFHKLFPGYGQLFIGVNTQDHAGPISSRAVNVRFNGRYFYNLQFGTGTFIHQHSFMFDFSQDYNVTLDYHYADNEIQTMDIRMYVDVFLITNSDNYDDCLPGQNGTFLYGYSNDLDPQTVIDVTTVISNFLDPLQYEIYGSVRFDTVLQEPIFLSDNLSFFNASVNSNLPDRNLGFSGSDRGSNVADMLRRFLSFKPICGTFILLNMKRNVHEEDLSDVIELLRKHRVYVFTVASMNMVNSADTFNQLRAMSIGSNGLLSFDNDIDFIQINYDLIIHIADRNPYYVASVQIRGNGSIELPIFHKISGYGYIFVGVNTQDHAGPISFQTGKVRFNGPTRSYNDDLLINSGTLITNYMAFDFSQDYNVTLDYHYDDNDIQTMDIRIYVTVAQVSGNGSVELPIFHKFSAESGVVYIGVNTQDHAGPVSNLAVDVEFDGPAGSYRYHLRYKAGTLITEWNNLDFSHDYNVTLAYHYADNEIQTMDIRMYVDVPVYQWPPYPSN